MLALASLVLSLPTRRNHPAPGWHYRVGSAPAGASTLEGDDMMQTIFGLTLPVTHFPIAPEQAHALADRIAATALQVREGAPAAFAAGARLDAELYLGARR